MTRRRRWTEEKLQEFQKDIDDGKSYKEIGKKWNLQRSGIYNLIAVYGLTGRCARKIELSRGV